jgi:Family of unknown function (DUF5689)
LIFNLKIDPQQFKILLKMNKKFQFFAVLAVLLLATFSLNSCLKKPIEAPPIGGDIVTNVVGNITVAEVKALHPVLGPGIFDPITEDKILKATVISDDRSGNFYKSVIVQDATGGIEILCNRSGLFIDYPAGREVYIKLKGLVLGDYNGLIQLGGYTFATNNSPSLEGILSGNIGSHILKGELNKPITPKETTIAALTKNDWQTLVILKDVQFSKADTGKFYADYIGKQSATSIIESCDGKTIDCRTSGYATFAANKKPAGKGTAICVVGAYNNKPQVTIREVSEVVMPNARCGAGGGTGGGGTGNLTLMTIAELRAVFTGAVTAGPVDKKIKGIVISDKAAGNITALNMIMQDATGGITVRFTSANAFLVGDEVEINVSGIELSEFSKVLQLNKTPNANGVKISSGNVVTPRLATVTQIIANQAAWESTLVQVLNATLSGGTGGTFAGNSSIDDGTGSIAIYTAATSPMAAISIPSGQKKVTAIVSQFNATNQLNLRSAADIQ